MEKKERNRKEFIKSILIVFLVIMLLLTFFSNTIMNHSLPEVSSAYIMSGSISTSVKGSGVISAVDPYVVSINEGRRIASVHVRKGDVVNKGDVLFELEEGESTELNDARTTLEELKDAYRTYILDQRISQSVVEAAENFDSAVIDEKMTRLNARLAVLTEKEDVVNSINDKIEVLNATLVDTRAQEALLKAAVTEQEKVDSIQAELDSIVSNFQSLPSDVQAQVQNETVQKIVALAAKKDEAQVKVDEAVAKFKPYGVDSIEAMTKLINDLKAAPANQIEDLTYKLAVANTEYKEASMNYEELKKEIADQKELQNKLIQINNAEIAYNKLLNKSAGNVVVAPVAGTITNVNVVAGERVMAQEELAVILMSGKDYVLEMSVPKEQAARIKVGDVGKANNSWYYYDMKLVVSAIKPDTSNPKSGDKIIVFTVTGSDIVVGQSVSVSVGERNSNYDKIVPNSAIREDKNGTYILIIKSKSTPLGNRYTATRVDVTKLASDETNTAISCGLEGYESVITTATKPISEGDLVRLPE